MGEIQQGGEVDRKGKEGKGKGRGGGANRMEHEGGKEEKEGEGSAEPQLHPLMLHASVLRSVTCDAYRGEKGITRILMLVCLFVFRSWPGSSIIQNSNSVCRQVFKCIPVYHLIAMATKITLDFLPPENLLLNTGCDLTYVCV